MSHQENHQQLDVSSINLLGHYSGFISRLIAFVIDAVVISIVTLVVSWFANLTLDMLQTRLLLDILIERVPIIAPVVIAIFHPVTAAILVLLFTILYHVLFWYFAGQTVGKALMGLRVVPLQGGRLPLWRSFLRYFGYYLSGILLGLGFIWIIIDDRRMAWHDKLAQTCVIYTWEARPDERFLHYATRVLKSRREAVDELKTQRTRLKRLIRKQREADGETHVFENDTD